MKKPPIPTFIAHYPQSKSNRALGFFIIVIVLIILTGAIIYFTNKKEDETA